MALTVEFAPDLILGLGRGKGNSTCAFTEAANQGGRGARVVSICLSDLWEQETVPRLRSVVPESWFEPLDVMRQDIRTVDYQQLFAGAKRVLCFWDAGGFDVAECVLGSILPELEGREHLVIVHDLSDARYSDESSSLYAGHPLWKPNARDARLRLGFLDSAVEHAIAIVDFVSRNRLTLQSADQDLHEEFDRHPEKISEMRQLLGDDLFSLQAHWFWFTLNEHPGPYTFPRFELPTQSGESGS